mmetsp:Transcript_2339/g.6826  ORF Transcript_2339/g.6826 Transcript_2339/m.6826 type:complete len:293 (-) Transcript_2339:584-1462(-)
MPSAFAEAQPRCLLQATRPVHRWRRAQTLGIACPPSARTRRGLPFGRVHRCRIPLPHRRRSLILRAPMQKSRRSCPLWRRRLLRSQFSSRRSMLQSRIQSLSPHQPRQFQARAQTSRSRRPRPTRSGCPSLQRRIRQGVRELRWTRRQRHLALILRSPSAEGQQPSSWSATQCRAIRQSPHCTWLPAPPTTPTEWGHGPPLTGRSPSRRLPPSRACGRMLPPPRPRPPLLASMRRDRLRPASRCRLPSPRRRRASRRNLRRSRRQRPPHRRRRRRPPQLRIPSRVALAASLP